MMLMLPPRMQPRISRADLDHRRLGMHQSQQLRSEHRAENSGHDAR